MNIENSNTEVVYDSREYKYTKECYLHIKQTIKDLSEDQTVLKPQRKADYNLKVVRSVQQHIAVSTVTTNKKKLRLLFTIYDEVRNKMDRVELEKQRLPVYMLNWLINLRSEYLQQTKSI